MSEWGRRTFGDPCRECSYGWSLSTADVLALVAALPAAYAETLEHCGGSEHTAELEWPAISYVCHVVDNLRVWAERLAAGALDGQVVITSYDNEGLAAARNYVGVPLPGALWSLGRAVADWSAAVDLASTKGVVLIHPERGPQSVLDTIRNNAHDAFHHRWDLTRITKTSTTH